MDSPPQKTGYTQSCIVTHKIHGLRLVSPPQGEFYKVSRDRETFRVWNFVCSPRVIVLQPTMQIATFVRLFVSAKPGEPFCVMNSKLLYGYIIHLTQSESRYHVVTLFANDICPCRVAISSLIPTFHKYRVSASAAERNFNSASVWALLFVSCATLPYKCYKGLCSKFVPN